jgi:hypothetical protein
MVIPRWRAVFRSVLATPVPNEAIKRRVSPAWDSTPASMRSVTVGTRTSASFTAAISSD